MKRITAFSIGFLVIIGCSSPPPAETGRKTMAPLSVPEIPLEVENLGSHVKIVDIPMEWGASKAKGATARSLWVRPTLKNTGKTPIGVVYGKIKITDEDGRILEEADEIFYFQPDEGVPLAPGKTSAKDPYQDGDPFLLIRDGMIVSDIPVKVEITITVAWEDSNLGRNGQPVE
jgi:hypothetical protein